MSGTLETKKTPTHTPTHPHTHTHTHTHTHLHTHTHTHTHTHGHTETNEVVFGIGGSGSSSRLDFMSVYLIFGAI